MGTAFYLSLNSIPAIFILGIFLLREKKKEPISIVLSAFALTYIIVIPLDILISIVDPFLDTNFQNKEANPFLTDEVFYKHYYSIFAFFRAAFLEEFLKFSVLFLFIYQNTNFDELSDGVIYGAAVGLGYAVVENYNYLFNYYLYDTPMLYFIQDRWWALIAHVTLGIIMGILLAKSRLLNVNKYLTLFSSLCVPIFLHGLHNYTYDSKILYENNIHFYLLIFYFVVILLSLVFLPKLETYKFRYEKNSIYGDYIKISFCGLIFSLILAIFFGFI